MQKPGGYGTGPRWRPLSEAFAVLWQAEAWRQELIQLLVLLAERGERRLHPLPWALPVPLRVHGRYSRAEIMAAFAVVNELGKPLTHQTGVLWHQPSQTDLLFITLNKSEALFSPSTRTRDLALGPSLFHWASQSHTRADSASGQRTIHHASRGSRVLLFVHEAAGFHAVVTARRAADLAASPSRFGVWGLPPTKATRVSGSCSSVSGDSLAAGAGDSGGVAARLLLGMKVALAV